MYNTLRKNSFWIGVIALVLVSSSFIFLYQTSEQEVTIDSQSVDTKLAPRSNTVDITSNENTAPELTTNYVENGNNQASVVLAAGCQLAVAVTSTVKLSTVQYGISVRNRGSEDCQNVTYSVFYPEQELYINANPKPSASDYYWKLGVVKAGVSLKKYQLTTRFIESFGGIELCASASNFNGDVCVVAAASTSVATSPLTPVAGTTTIISNPSPMAPAPISSSNPSTSFAPPSGKEYGVWVWNSPVAMSASKMDQTIKSVKAAGFNTIYVTIDDVQNYDTVKYTAALAAFISKASSQGLAVDAVAGGSDWAKPANRAKGFAMIDFAATYNKTNPKLRGFQYDVEPYLLPEYEGNKETVLTDFVNFIDESSKRLEGSGLTFGVVIPHFYDSTQSWTPKVTFGGVSNFTFDHLRNILDRGNGNSIIIMSYRNYFAGKGGTEELSRPEIEQSNKTKIIVAQETGNVEPAYVTFFGTTKSSLFTSLNSIYGTFSGNQGFGGAAVHYLETYLALP